MIADLTFWYGLGFNDIATMPISALENYINYLPAEQASYKLLLAEAHMMATGDPKTARRMLKDAQRVANEGLTGRGGIMPTPSDLARMGIGMRIVGEV